MLVPRGIALGLVSLVLVASVAPKADDPKVEGDLKKMQGEWTSPVSDNAEGHWEFKADVLKFKSPKREYTTKVKLDAKASPAQVDFMVTEGPEDSKGKTLIGIYKFDGAKLIFCVGGADSARPTEFKPEEMKSFLFELTKAK